MPREQLLLGRRSAATTRAPKPVPSTPFPADPANKIPSYHTMHPVNPQNTKKSSEYGLDVEEWPGKGAAAHRAVVRESDVPDRGDATGAAVGAVRADDHGAAAATAAGAWRTATLLRAWRPATPTRPAARSMAGVLAALEGAESGGGACVWTELVWKAIPS